MTLWFWWAIAFLGTHELDAMTAKEWRLLPGLSRLDDHIGQQIFVIAHVPLFVLLAVGLSGTYGRTWQIGVDIFCVLHVFAHLAFLKHPQNQFRGVSSWLLIVGAGLCGLCDLGHLYNVLVFFSHI